MHAENDARRSCSDLRPDMVEDGSLKSSHGGGRVAENEARRLYGDRRPDTFQDNVRNRAQDIMLDELKYNNFYETNLNVEMP